MYFSALTALALGTSVASAWSVQTFKTVPFRPPVFEVTKSGDSLAPGLLFLTTTSRADPASIIITDDGELVWSSKAGNFFDLNAQQLNGQTVLTYWNGTGSPNPAVHGHGYGRVHILDSSYTPIYTICPKLELVTPGSVHYDCKVDIHEAYVTQRGSLLVTAYNITGADLTSVNGPADGYVYDCLVYEIDIKTQEVLFEWSALNGGFQVSDTKEPIGNSGSYTNPFDFFHINSIQDVDGGYLVNSRHLWTTSKLDTKGNIEWRFEGSTGGDFSLEDGVNFAWEHQSRVLDSTPSTFTFSMFDNANAGGKFHGVNQTKGRIFQLDLEKKTSTQLQEFYDPNQVLYSDSQGSFKKLANGNVLMGYGQLPVVREYGPDGDLRLDIQFGEIPGNQDSYRAFRVEWEGTPSAPPIVVVEDGTAYVSWNGATGVQSWDVYEGSRATRLAYSKTVASTGFESSFSIQGSTKFVQAVPRTTKGRGKASAVIQVAR